MSFQIKHGIFKLNLSDHYAVLGVDLEASPQEIRNKYLKIAQKLHPDTCKSKTDPEKQYASEILSKLVNPAYEELSKDKTRSEYLLILSQIGQRAAQEKEQHTFSFEAAQKLAKAGDAYELEYKNLLKKLTSEQYQSLEILPHTIAQISELNLAYLIHQESQGLPKTPQKSNNVVSDRAKTNIPGTEFQKTTITQNQKTQTDEGNSARQVGSYVRRALEYMEKEAFTQAIAEMKDGIKLDPNNSSCHALLGLAYLKQNQISMAKVHINKAWQVNPQDPIVIKSKQELDKLEKASALGQNAGKGNRPSANSTSSKPGNGTIFGGLFGGKKQ
jgi:curved DNA-binding protein CbpA